MPCNPDFAPDSEFASVEVVALRSYKSASVIEVSPRPIEPDVQVRSDISDQKLELKTISTQPSKVLVETELQLSPFKKRITCLWSVTIALIVATLPLAVLVAIEYWPETQLYNPHLMEVSDRLMFNSRLANLMDLLELYSHKQISLFYQFGSPLEAITSPNVVDLVLPKPQDMDPEVFKLITQVLEYIRPVSVVL